MQSAAQLHHAALVVALDLPINENGTLKNCRKKGERVRRTSKSLTCTAASRSVREPPDSFTAPMVRHSFVLQRCQRYSALRSARRGRQIARFHASLGLPTCIVSRGRKPSPNSLKVGPVCLQHTPEVRKKSAHGKGTRCLATCRPMLDVPVQLQPIGHFGSRFGGS
jgi:hypothetical protein